MSVVLGCEKEPDQSTVVAQSAVAPAIETPANASTDPAPIVERLDAPRRASRIRLQPLWGIGGPLDPGRLIQPMSLAMARFGVLVSEMDGHRVLVFRERDGKLVDSLGRWGSGPGEFSRVPQLLGVLDHPLAFEGANGRIAELALGQAPRTSSVSTARRWMTACALSPTRVLLQHYGRRSDGYFVTTLGDGAALVDSFAYPFAELEGVDPLARQAPLQQVDDSTCAILPAYWNRFALVRAGTIEDRGEHRAVGATHDC